jgi:NADPH-dependent curcumin reductase CurA
MPADFLFLLLYFSMPDIKNMYFENVGGFQFQAAFNCLKKHGRIAVCGRLFQL